MSHLWQQAPSLGLAQDEKGQAILELFWVILLSLVVCVEVGSVLWKQWRHVGCLYHVFEATHARVVGAPAHRSVFLVRFKGPSGGPRGQVTGVTDCGEQKKEEVVLPFLESAQW